MVSGRFELYVRRAGVVVNLQPHGIIFLSLYGVSDFSLDGMSEVETSPVGYLACL